MERPLTGTGPPAELTPGIVATIEHATTQPIISRTPNARARAMDDGFAFDRMKTM